VTQVELLMMGMLFSISADTSETASGKHSCNAVALIMLLIWVAREVLT